MRSGGGKAKGAGFERMVCKRLSLWLSQGRRDDLFWRSAMSGGRATLKSGRKAQAGDISAIHSEGDTFLQDVFIECKNYANLDLVAFLLGKDKGKLSKFWETALMQAAETNKRYTLLIGKEDYRPIFVLTSPNWLLDSENELYPILSGDSFQLYWFDDLFPKPEKPRIDRGTFPRRAETRHNK